MKKVENSKKEDWKEANRIRALNLYEAGWHQSHIAQALGVCQSTVSIWIKKYRISGLEGLKTQKNKGKEPLLTEEQKNQLPELLKKGAEHYGFRGNIWTQERISQVIYKEFGVKYHYTHAGRIIRSLGWSLQKPEKQPIQRKEEEIEKWKEEDWPKLKKKQKKTNKQ